jgi:hypothetical protein
VALTVPAVAVAVPLGDSEVAPSELVAPAGSAGGTGTTTNEVVPTDPTYPVPDVGVKTALRASVPTGRVAVVVVATPPLTVAEAPMSFPASSNCTVPVAAGLIVAVRVSEVPTNCGLAGEAVKTVVVEIGLTVKLNGPVEPEYPLPEVGVKTAVRASAPTGRAAVVVVATPLLTFTAAPMSFPASSNCTVPVAADGLMVAVNVSEVPNVCGLVGAAVNTVVVAMALTV